MNDPYTGPAIVELKGFTKLAGYISEVEQYGEKMARLDIPGPDGTTALTQFFPGSSIHRVTPVSEEIVRAYGPAHLPQPVVRYELPALPEPRPTGAAIDYDDPDDREHDDEGAALFDRADGGPF